jgi:hypothetical protein
VAQCRTLRKVRGLMSRECISPSAHLAGCCAALRHAIALIT